MAKQLPPPACIYQETRLGLSPTAASIRIPLGFDSTASPVSRESPKRRRVDKQAHDEVEWSKAHLASDASIFFRSAQDEAAPDSILWRVLEDGKLLELQGIDLHTPGKDALPAPTTLSFSLPDRIIPFGVHLASEKAASGNGGDDLIVFIITRKPDLYRLRLKKDAFVNAKYFEDSTLRSRWLSKCTPTAFSYRHPYRAHVRSATELWLSLNDGSLVRMEWDQNSKWTETRFSENWGGSFMGILRKSNTTVKFEGADVDVRAAVSISLSPSDKVVWTVCLDHALRAWSIASGKVILTHDLAGNEERDFGRPFDQPLDPYQPHLLTIDVPRTKRHQERYQLFTFSPLKKSFNFWLAQDAESEGVTLSEEHLHFSFVPPIDLLLGMGDWRLESYHFIPPVDGRSHDLDVWIMVRSAGVTTVLQNNFNPYSRASDLKVVWNYNWSSVHPGPESTEELKLHPQNPLVTNIGQMEVGVTSISEKFLDFLLCDGRFSPDLLETALVVYQRGVNQGPRPGSRPGSKGMTLRDILLQTVKPTEIDLAGSESPADGLLETERATARQWNMFYGVVQDLQKQVERPLRLAFDNTNRLAWIASAGHASPVRTCCDAEIYWHNKDQFPSLEVNTPSPITVAVQNAKQNLQAGALLNALNVLKEGLSKDFLETFRMALLADAQGAMNETHVLAAPERMAAIYEISNLFGQLSDAAYDKLSEALTVIGGFENIATRPFQILVTALAVQQPDRHALTSATPYSIRMLVRGAQDTVQLGREVLLLIAVFTIFTAVELKSEDISSRFDPELVFSLIIPRVYEYELLSFLTTTTVFSRGGPEQSILEDIAGTKARPPNLEDAPESQLLTYWIRTWTFMLTVDNDLSRVGTSVLCHLLNAEDLQTASKALSFVNDEPWSKYVKGRFYLASGQHHEAAQFFLDAAPDLCKSTFDVRSRDQAELLNADEVDAFGDGRLKYFMHIMSLFDKQDSMSYVADFAQLSLAASDKAVSPNVVVGALQSTNDKQEKRQKTEILSRMFTAAMRMGRFTDAYFALSKYGDHALFVCPLPISVASY